MKKFSVVSYGLVSPGQMTLEAAACLRSCGAVFSNSVDAATAESLRASGIALKGRPFRPYKAVTAEVLKALRDHDHVGFLTYGNPVFMNPPLEGLLAAVAPRAEVRVYPGVSSLDLMMNMFRMTALPGRGLLVCDLNFSAKDPGIEKGRDMFFFAPFRLNSSENRAARKALLAAFSRRLPAGFPVYLVKCGPGPGEGEAVAGTAGGLARLLDLCDEQHTLAVFSGGAIPRLPGLRVRTARPG